jgi:hypothetical protein
MGQDESDLLLLQKPVKRRWKKMDIPAHLCFPHECMQRIKRENAVLEVQQLFLYRGVQ